MNELGASLNREDYIAYCKASAKPLSEECQQLLIEARTEQLQPLLLFGGAISSRPHHLVRKTGLEQAKLFADEWDKVRM